MVYVPYSAPLPFYFINYGKRVGLHKFYIIIKPELKDILINCEIYVDYFNYSPLELHDMAIGLPPPINKPITRSNVEFNIAKCACNLKDSGNYKFYVKFKNNNDYVKYKRFMAKWKLKV